MIDKRAFVSFDEPCFFQCKHCYTYGIERKQIRTIDEIVASLSGSDFDVIYVSQKTDNFSTPQKGLNLCEKLFEKYNSNLFIITRSVFDTNDLNRLIELKKKVNKSGKKLFIAVSINSLESNFICEDTQRVFSPERRIEFLKTLSIEGFKPMLMLRPIFPSSMIPIDECLRIIDTCTPFVSCIVGSGLGVNADVLNRLGLNDADFIYSNNQEYLQGAIVCEIKFVDVEHEITRIKAHCLKSNCIFFDHSLPALNYIDSL